MHHDKELHLDVIVNIMIRASASASRYSSVFFSITDSDSPVATDSNHRRHVFLTRAYTQSAMLSAVCRRKADDFAEMLTAAPMRAELTRSGW